MLRRGLSGRCERDHGALDRPSPALTPYNGTRDSHVRFEVMPLSGEAIRLMNYIDDVSVTLRRVLAFVPTLSAEERARVFDHLKASSPSIDDVAEALKAE